MIDSLAFIENFLAHEYDPVQAHEYYLRNRKLKGRGSATEKAGAKAYESHQTSDAQKRLNSDLKKAPVKLSKVRRIGAAEQKLIRARSLAMRVKDPTVKADMLARLSVAEKKLRRVKGTIDLINPKPKKAAPKKVKEPPPLPKTQAGYPGKPHKLGTRMEEDMSPWASPGGKELSTYDQGPHGLGKAVYKDGYVYDAKVGWIKPKSKTSASTRSNNK